MIDHCSECYRSKEFNQNRGTLWRQQRFNPAIIDTEIFNYS